jgi:hypothetical protein
MPDWQRHTPAPPSARVPADGGAPGHLRLRPFGVDERDLAVDFEGTPRPLLITEILELCTEAGGDGARPPGRDFFWGLTVGARTEALLALADAGVYVALRCPAPDCAQELEVDISLAEIAELQDSHGAEEYAAVPFGDSTLRLRRPRGRDQLDWLGRRFADEREVAREMIRTLAEDEGAALAACVRGAEELAVAISDVMEEFDPLVNFSLRVRCHFCGEESEHAFDLEEYALARLRRAQGRLLLTVHRLASRYHWDERQIFSVPDWRRRHYLALLDGKENH